MSCASTHSGPCIYTDLHGYVCAHCFFARTYDTIKTTLSTPTWLKGVEPNGDGGWKVVSSFEGNFPSRIKQLPLNELFSFHTVKKVVLEADGYQPYLVSPEKGLRALIKSVLDLAKEPARQCVDEVDDILNILEHQLTKTFTHYWQVHHILVDIVSSAASATPGLGRYPPLKKEVVTIASAALDNFRVEAKKMVVALIDMERVYVPPQHFIRLVQRRYAILNQLNM
eukprot:Gb_19014 [translate_table: standard]